MAQRILTLSGYLLRRLVFSLSGIIYFLLGLVFWRIFFDPTQFTPESDYYALVIGLFGGSISFLITLSVAARAHNAANYPLLARLPSRVEHLTAVLTSALAFSFLLQGVVALLATFRGPALPLGRVLEIPPLWLAIDILAAVLALHASDLVTVGWSRVYLFGLLALFLFGQSLDANAGNWLSERAIGISNWFLRLGWPAFGTVFNTISRWLANSGLMSVGRLFGFVFWPFHAISDGIVAGFFQPLQALAPAILLLYATVLFMLAAELFAHKDLYLTE